MCREFVAMNQRAVRAMNHDGIDFTWLKSQWRISKLDQWDVVELVQELRILLAVTDKSFLVLRIDGICWNFIGYTDDLERNILIINAGVRISRVEIF